jgi:hypothetical protein
VSRADSQHGFVEARRLSRWVSPLITLAVALLINAGCNREATKPTAFFPASSEVAGWAIAGDIRTFEAADLWKYIDGEAERYLKAGVQRVFTADYRYQNKFDAVTDIYVMEGAEGAKKILDSEPMVDAKPVQLGDSARLYGQSLIWRKGVYLVRIVAFQESTETSQAILDLGRDIERRLTR